MSKLSINTTKNYSLNFDKKKRKSKQIKFLIFHYTGMKRESKAIKRLTSIKSEVSSHYFIKNNGKTQSIVVQGKNYNVITDDGTREYLGQKYFVFYLEATT